MQLMFGSHALCVLLAIVVAVAAGAPAVAMDAMQQAQLQLQQELGRNNRLAERCLQGPYYVFLDYVPSEWEAQWAHFSEAWQHKICKMMTKPQHAKRGRAWLEGAAGWLSPGHGASAAPRYDILPALDRKLWSRFRYMDVCAGLGAHGAVRPDAQLSTVDILIEPLVGLLRHPFARDYYDRWSCVPDGEHPATGLEDRAYILPNAIPAPVFSEMYPGRRFLFDMGSAHFGTSLRWILDTYKRFGITFDRIWAWEARTLNQTDYWRDVDDESYAKLTFFNMPVSANAADKGHPFFVLKQIFRPGDFVVIKLDIDHPETELSIMRQIANSPRLLRMISEMYFEQHFTVPETTHFFGETGVSYPEALQHLGAMRTAGLRLHYWP